MVNIQCQEEDENYVYARFLFFFLRSGADLLNGHCVFGAEPQMCSDSLCTTKQ